MASILQNVSNQFFTFALVSSTSTSGFSVSTNTATSSSSNGHNPGFAIYHTADFALRGNAAGTAKFLGNGQWAYSIPLSETVSNKISYFIRCLNCVPIDLQFYTDKGVPTVSSSGALTIAPNNDKTGYSLTQAFPSNFASLAISTGGSVTVSTNDDKAGYSLTQSFPANFSSLGISSANGGLSIAQSFPSNFGSLLVSGGGAGRITVGTMSDKTGYSLNQSFPANFSSLTIDSSGQVTALTVLDKTAYSLAQGFPANFANTIINGAGRSAVNTNIQQVKGQSTPFPFVMTRAAVPTTGLSVVGQRIRNGATFESMDNKVTEIVDGLYSVTLTSNDLNSQGVLLRFTSTTTATSSSTSPVDDRPIWINPLP